MRAALLDVLWIVALLVVLGVVAGVVWWQLVDLPTYQRTRTGAVMDQLELGRRIKADGWFSAVGVVAALGAGFALIGLRRRDPLLVLVLGTLASVGAGLIALKVGTTLGHHDVSVEVRGVAVGARVPDSLTLISHAALLVWPVGFLVASVATLLASDPDPAPRDQPAEESVAPLPAG